MSPRSRRLSFVLLAFLPLAGLGPPAATQEAASPLAPLERLVGGSWQIGELRHVFEWGIGGHTLIARSYDAAGNFVNEARWFWHPGEKKIKGISIDASGQTLAEMTTTIEGNTMTNRLELFGAEGPGGSFTGEWVFVDENRYDWTLYRETPDGPEKQFEMTGIRAPANEPSPAAGDG